SQSLRCFDPNPRKPRWSVRSPSQTSRLRDSATNKSFKETEDTKNPTEIMSSESDDISQIKSTPLPHCCEQNEE
ncbi:hypothetical protein TNCT_384191, partial [Trichonephila clavata]